LCLLLPAPAARATSPDQEVPDWQRYDEAWRGGAHNGEFYLQQGNAHLLAGHLPRAILAYRRAERFLASDPRLQENLADARRRVSYPPATTPPEPDSGPWRLARPVQMRIAIGCYLVGWCLIGWRLLRSGRGPGWVATTAVGTGFLLGFDTYRYEQADRARPLAVVAGDRVVLYRGNSEHYPRVEINRKEVLVPPGVEARVGATRPNGWVQLRIGTDLIGWVRRDQVLIDEPLPDR
jgi:hypothetical protein